MIQDPGLALLAGWQNFYILTGTAAATLTGLMFVVATLFAGLDVHVPTMNEALSAFNTPTVVHFCAVLLLAALLSTPWSSLTQAGQVLGLAGLGGVGYLVLVMRRVHRMSGYRAPLKDWLWYVVFPFGAYLALAVAAWLLTAYPAAALYGIGAALLALLFTGIHNAWDLVTYLSIDRAHPETKPPE